MDATVHVDTCENLRRVLVVERGKPAAVPEVGCTRRDVLGLFLVKTVSNVVVNTEGPNPTVWLRQGSVDLRPRGPGGPWSEMPTGLVAFGGAGIGKYRDQLFLLCGNVSPCQGSNTRTTFSLGGTFWLSRYIGAEGAYVQPADVNVSGTGSNFHFTSKLEAHFFTINGKIGVPAGHARIYGQAGTNYHSASQTTTQTNDDVQLTINGVATTVPGGTQKIEIKTGGWGWQFGGGLEIWIKKSIGIYGEVARTRIKGDSVEGPQGKMSDYITTILGGMRFKIGK
jgi:opacity protein-like surface antigen